MEKDRSVNTNGQELAASDWDTTSHLAAVTQDYVAQEFFRPWPFGSNAIVAKGVIPYGYSGVNAGGVNGNGSDPRHAALVTTTTSITPSILIYPFRAIIGSLDTVPSASPLEEWREIRSVVVADGTVGSAFLPNRVNLAATIANNRCDLVYLHVTLGAVSLNEQRFVRDPSTGALTRPALDVELSDKWTILVASSAEATSPTRPALPADSGSDFYIPLAYCYLTHPSSGAVFAERIHEIAPVIPLSRTTGAATLQPGNQQWNPTGPMLTATPFQVASTPHRPDTYMPPSMNGQESRLFFFKWDGTPKSPAVSSDVLLDDSADWRNRAFKYVVQARNNSGASRAAWSASGVSSYAPGAPFSAGQAGLGQEQSIGFGQSFIVDTLVPFGVANGSAVCVLEPAWLSKIAANVVIYVSQTTGALRLFTSGDPGANLFIWLDATGPFSQVVGGGA